MPAMSSRCALFLLFLLIIPLTITIAIPSFDNFFTTKDFQPSVVGFSGFNGATADSGNAVVGGNNDYIALASTTNYYAKTTTPSSQDNFGNWDSMLLAEQQSPLSTTNYGQAQGLPQGSVHKIGGEDFLVPGGENQLPTFDEEQTRPNHLVTPQLDNTADTESLPRPNTNICKKNPKESIPVCHSMYERTMVPPSLELEMITTSTFVTHPTLSFAFLLLFLPFFLTFTYHSYLLHSKKN